jgi:hypothetical protein
MTFEGSLYFSERHPYSNSVYGSKKYKEWLKRRKIIFSRKRNDGYRRVGKKGSVVR